MKKLHNFSFASFYTGKHYWSNLCFGWYGDEPDKASRGSTVCNLQVASLMKYIVCYLTVYRILQTHGKQIQYTFGTHSL